MRARICLITGVLLWAAVNKTVAQTMPLSPTALATSADGSTLYVACATGNRVLRFDSASRQVSGSLSVPKAPLGLALSMDGRQLFVACAAPESQVCIIDPARMEILGTVPAGHTAMAPVPSPDGRKLYVCNRFNHDVSVIDLIAKKEVRRIAVQREPVSAAITRNGKYLLVANHLHTGRADVDYVAAAVSVIDTDSDKVINELQLPTGSGSLNEIGISPEGQYAVVTHLVGRCNRLPTHATEGWINANALTLINLVTMKVHGTMLLDDHYQGAANPWGVAWSPDGATLVVTHAGTHEVSVIDFQRWIARWPALPTSYSPVQIAEVYAATKAKYELPDDLPFFAGSRHRIKLSRGDLGPRAVVVAGHTAFAANYFSDTLTAIDLSAGQPAARSIALAPPPVMDAVRQGEFYFHDAGICYEGWQSCSSCHPGEARVDGLNWDLLQDGVGNPKNTKSLLLAPKTPPVMSLGGRAHAKDAIRAGIQNILFTTQFEEVVNAIEAYLQSLKPIASPYLVRGELSEAAKRGKRVFLRAGCAQCHVPGLYTDLHPHDVGTRAPGDKPTDRFYTPPLIEVWRTAPYLHDGSAATLRDVIVTRNPKGEHGETANLSNQAIDDLCAYVLSL